MLASKLRAENRYFRKKWSHEPALTTSANAQPAVARKTTTYEAPQASFASRGEAKLEHRKCTWTQYLQVRVAVGRLLWRRYLKTT